MASLSEVVITCRGCLEDQPGQMAHMDIGGCLYDGPDIKDYEQDDEQDYEQDDEQDYEQDDEFGGEFDDELDEYQSINSDKIYYLIRMIYLLFLELKNTCTRS